MSRFAVLLILLIGCTSDRSADERTGERAGEPAAPERDAGGEPLRLQPGVEGVVSVPLGACAGPPGRTLRTLIVGNSQIYFFDLPKILSDVSRSAPAACPRIAAEGFTRGGQNLRSLWEDGDALGRDLVTVLRDGHYDVVVLSECIDLVELPPPKEQFVTYATKMIDAVRATGARPVLYASPYPNQEGHFGFVEMAAPQLELGRRLDVTVAAAGLAWLRVWRELPSIVLHHVDDAHPGPNGSLISAMVLYAAITRATPIGLTTSPPIECYRGMCPPDPLVTPHEGEVFQRAAWEEAMATALGPR
jgi:hypothetical protein